MEPGRLALTLCAAATLLVAPMTTGVASGDPPAWACAASGSSSVTADAAGAPSALARGHATEGQAFVRDRGSGATARDLPASAKGRAPSAFTVTVPVYWHVVTDGPAGALTDAQIRGQISALNRGFSGGEGGTL